MITLTLTIGRRPELLRTTLASLLPKFDFEHVIAVNDFRDEATNQVFREMCPRGELIVPSQQLGHHRAVDELYARVRTMFVFHCEDDWLFDTHLDLAAAITLLRSTPAASSVCVRKTEDFHFSSDVSKKILLSSANDVRYARLDGLHDQWHGYTFNPHLISMDTVREIGKFGAFKKERHVSRFLRKKGKFVAYMQPGTCHHIGEDNSVSNPSQKDNGFIARILKKLRFAGE